MKKTLLLLYIIILKISVFAGDENIVKFSKKHSLNGATYGIDEEFNTDKVIKAEDYGEYSAFSYVVNKADSEIVYKYVFNEKNLNVYSKLIGSSDVKELLTIKGLEVEKALNDGYELKKEYRGLSIFSKEEKIYFIFEPRSFSGIERNAYIKIMKLDKIEMMDSVLGIEELYF